MGKKPFIVLVALCALIGAGCSPKNKPAAADPFTYNLNMVHHNPGRAPFNTKYNDPYYLKKQGFNGQVPRIFLPCAVTYNSFDPEIMPEGSKIRMETEAYAQHLDSMFHRAKMAGIPVYPFTDLLVVPGTIKAKYGNEMGAEKKVDDENVLGGTRLQSSILRPRTEEILRVQLREIFKRFPDLDGLTARFGETYIHEFPDYAGGSPADTREEHIKLINILRDEVCVKLNKKVFYRTWGYGTTGSFHTDTSFYLGVTNAVEPHPNLIFSVKHVKGDYIRLHAFNPCLGIGRHKQIVEISCNPAGLYGKNAHPYYIGQGVIEGWEEFAWIKNEGPAACLRNLINLPQMAGICTWARGDGWEGPYLTNELWVDLNIQVFDRFAREPWRSEEELFNEAAQARFGVKGEDLKKLRELCLLSATAVMHGQATVYAHVSDWWCRDEYLTAVDLKPVVKAGKIKEALMEKDEAITMWKKIESLSREIRLPDPADQEYLEVSSTYGRIKYQIIGQIWKMQLLAAESEITGNPFDNATMQTYIADYDRLWEEWKQLKATRPACPTLYRDDTAEHCPYPPFHEVLEKYREKVALVL